MLSTTKIIRMRLKAWLILNAGIPFGSTWHDVAQRMNVKDVLGMEIEFNRLADMLYEADEELRAEHGNMSKREFYGSFLIR